MSYNIKRVVCYYYSKSIDAKFDNFSLILQGLQSNKIKM